MDHAVELSEVLQRRLHPGLGARGFGRLIGMQQHALGAGLLGVEGAALEVAWVAQAQAQAMAIAEEPLGHGPADAAAGAADQECAHGLSWAA